MPLGRGLSVSAACTEKCDSYLLQPGGLRAVGTVSRWRERPGATQYPVPYGPRLTTGIDFSFKPTGRLAPRCY